MIAHFQLVYHADYNVVDSAELINSELKCLEQWLKSNKISINANNTKFMLFSYNENIHFPLIKIGNNAIGEASDTKCLGIHLDERLNFKNHVAQVSLKVSKSIGHLYKLNRYLHETIFKTLYISLIHPYLSYGIEAWHGTYKIILLKSLFFKIEPYTRNK